MSEVQRWFEAVFFGLLGRRRGEAEATETRREMRGAAATDTPGVSAIREQQRLAELRCHTSPEPLLLVNPSPERLSVFACVSLRRGKREQGKGRSRMPK